MEEMYGLSIVAHYYSVVGILVVVFINFLILKKTTIIKDYKRAMSLFTPISFIALGSVIFTGIIMMASKHLDFSFDNIIMILFSFIIIFLEIKRLGLLKGLREDFLKYKKTVNSIFLAEIVLTLSISIWMLI